MDDKLYRMKSFNEIIKFIREARVIGCGEATHGQLQITRYRIALFKYLVIHHDFRLFLLEEQYSACTPIDLYIKTGKGNPKQIMEDCFIFPWLHPEILNLIKWMRMWNKQHMTADAVSFIGFDVQHRCSRVRGSLTGFNMKYVRKFIRISRNETDFPKMREWRDHAMADMVMAILKMQSGRAFIYAHNGHIRKTGQWLGHYIKSNLGSNYISIGNTFSNGMYYGLREDMTGFRCIAPTPIRYPFSDGFYISSQLKKHVKLHNGGSLAVKKIPHIDSSNFDAFIYIKTEKCTTPYI